MVSFFRRLWGQRSENITGGAAIIAAASFASRILGVFRDRILAGEFGAGDTLDVYYAAFRLPDLLYNLLIVGALTAGFIPVFVAARDASRKRGETRSTEHWDIANAFLTTAIAGLAVLCAIMIVLSPYIIPWLTPGFSPEKTAAVARLSRIIFLSPLLLGASAVLGGVLQSYRNFFVYSLAPIFYNIGIIIGALFFVPVMGESGLAWGVVLGAAFHFLVQVPAVVALRWPFRFSFDFANAGMRKIWWLMLPRTIALGATQINLLVLTGIISFLSVGSLTIFNLAHNLISVPVAVFGISYALAVFPTLTERAQAEDRGGFQNAFIKAASQILFFIIPMTVLFLVLRAQIVRVVLGSSVMFDWNDTVLTFTTMGWLAVSLFAQALRPLFIRGLYAYFDTFNPLIAGIAADVVILGGAVVLARVYGVVGVAMAISVGAILELALLWFVLRRRAGALQDRPFVLSVGKFLVAGFIMAFVAQGVKTGLGAAMGTSTFVGIALQGGLATLFALLAYVAVLLLLKSEEITDVIEAVQHRVFGYSVKHAGLNEGEGL